MIVRCKHIKKGDGGFVDGCGWQGERQLLSTNVHKCPSCGSSILRPMEAEVKEGYEPKNLMGEMGQICEEAGEVLKHFGKILRFGLDNVYIDPSKIYTSNPESNRQAFYRELDDLFDCILRIKLRNSKNPTEPLGDSSQVPYMELANAAQEYLAVLSEANVELVHQHIHGVSRRGRLRAAYAKLSAQLGKAHGVGL